MRAVILAGGLGTRLSEETMVKPKPMLEIGGKPMLWHIIKTYSAHGINEFVICCGYKGHMIEEYLSTCSLCFPAQNVVSIEMIMRYFKTAQGLTLYLFRNWLNSQQNFS